MRILLVDDDFVDRESVRRILRKSVSGSEVVEAATVDEGLQLFHTERFDLVLLDYTMPPRDGFEMLLELRMAPLDTGTAIVMMSTAEHQSIALECIKAGAQDFIPKSEISGPRLHRAILHAQTRFEMEKKLYQNYTRVKHMAESDSLTGLANRYVFEENFRRIISGMTRHRLKNALILLDLDFFKHINDVHGHDVGDLFLKAVAQKLKTCLRGSELLARLGGDEFAIILANLERPQDASRVAQRVLSVLVDPFEFNGIQIKSGASVGIALHPDNGTTFEELYKNADVALYRAKRSGRNKLCFFHEGLQRQFALRHEMELRLREAIDNGELEMHYQPLFQCNGSEKNLRRVGMEALLRWTHQGRQCMPSEFMAVAEDTRLIHKIGRFAIQTAISQLAQWRARATEPLLLTINLSPMELMTPDIAEVILSCLESHQISADQLELDVTEGALLNDGPERERNLQVLIEAGCRVVLDGFGEGMTSLTQLTKHRLVAVKLARSLGNSLVPNPLAANASDVPPGRGHSKLSRSTEQALVTAIVLSCRCLGLEVFVSGVETQAQLEAALTLGAHRVQGNFLGMPQPADAFENHFAAAMP